MIYAMYSFRFDLPGADPGQMSFEKDDSKTDLLISLAEDVEDSLEPIENLGGESAAEAARDAIDDLRQLAEEAKTKDVKVGWDRWSMGDASLEIFFADTYPEVVEVFRDTVLDVCADKFYDYAELDEEDAEEYEDDEMYDLYNRILSMKEGIREEEFVQIFDGVADLYYGSVF